MQTKQPPVHSVRKFTGIAATLALCSAGQLQAQITDLAAFGAEGYTPYGNLVTDGTNLYGTTYQGGNYNDGVVFSVPVGGGAATILANFNGNDGANPYAGLTLVGNTLYGTTYSGGGVSGNGGNGGEVFSLPVTGGTPTVLVSFTGTNGANPYGGLLRVGSTLYGTTRYGGISGDYGTIFSIPVGGGTFTSMSFYGTLASNPVGPLTVSANGTTLYGTTITGGENNDNGGTVYSLSISTPGSVPTVLGNLNGTNGSSPYGGVTLAGNTLFGTASAGGTGEGTLFSLPVGGGTITDLWNFAGGNGMVPQGSLTLVGATLYGTTSEGGTSNDGTVFTESAAGGTPTVVDDFDGTDGSLVYSGLTLLGDTLYGTTQDGTGGGGMVFSVPAPEPCSAALLAGGILGLAAMRRRRKGKF